MNRTLSETENFYHALLINMELCAGCSHCMRVCPTEAIRIRDGKAVIRENKCIDCGECFRVCPSSAIQVAEDDLATIKPFRHRIALIPSVFFGQFSRKLSHELICSAILQLGFTEIYEIERTAGFLAEKQREYLQSGECPNAAISAYCPAVLRLIQVKFPGLVDTIIPLKPPVDIAALHVKKLLTDRGVPEEEIGLFYFTPCAAKIAALKSPVGEEKSLITGVVNMNSVYNQVLTLISQEGLRDKSPEAFPSPGKTGILWALTHGEARNIEGRALSIDGIGNVIDFLEKLEDEDLGRINFLELRACEQSCAGGILVSGNRFLTAEKLYKQAAGMNELVKNSELTLDKAYLERHIRLSKIQPRSSLALDSDMQKAMEKMQRIRSLMSALPGIDCGACGSPSCQALAEDIVKEEAEPYYCVFKPEYSSLGTMHYKDELYRMSMIWGKEKFSKIKKKGNDNDRE